MESYSNIFHPSGSTLERQWAREIDEVLARVLKSWDYAIFEVDFIWCFAAVKNFWWVLEHLSRVTNFKKGNVLGVKLRKSPTIMPQKLTTLPVAIATLWNGFPWNTIYVFDWKSFKVRKMNVFSFSCFIQTPSSNSLLSLCMKKRSMLGTIRNSKWVDIEYFLSIYSSLNMIYCCGMRLGVNKNEAMWPATK